MTPTLTRFPPAQLAVIALAAQGCGNLEIAEQLHLSVAAVKGRFATAMRTTGAGSRAGLVIQACRWGQLQDLPRPDVRRLTLSTADLETLRDAAADLTCKQIASSRRITEDNAKDRCRALYRRLGATDRAHAVLIAWQLRILPEVPR